jgi:N utilization substance protein A
MAIDAKQFLSALEIIEAEKGIPRETVINALKEAMTKGFKKELGRGDYVDIEVTIDPENGILDVKYDKLVVEEVFDPESEISIEEARKINPDAQEGDELMVSAPVDQLRKTTVLSVKSILKQKFTEAEKEVLYENFKDKINTIITGRVEKADERGLTVNIGKTSVFLPKNYMLRDEKYYVGDVIKLYVKDVASGSKGAHINVSRTDAGFLRCLLEEIITEIYEGTISIKKIVRRGGVRSKVAVFSPDPNIDPAGACIGLGGTRIQKIVSQLGNGAAKEKIDIISYSENKGLFIMDALKPARVSGIILNIEKQAATVIVKDDSLLTAYGKGHINLKLASDLTGFALELKTESEAYEQGLTFQSYEELQALEIEAKEKAQMELRQAQYQASNAATVLPGLPEGYVAPQERVYEDDSQDDDLNEALIEASENETPVVEETPVAPVIEETPVVEETPAPTPVVEEEVEVTEVQTTTSLEDLEKSLEEKANRIKEKAARKNYHHKKANKEVEEEAKPSSIISSENATRMSIYTEDEIREMEEEEAREEYYEEDDIDYDEYDDYYDDDNN